MSSVEAAAVTEPQAPAMVTDLQAILLHVTPQTEPGIDWAQVMARVYENENVPARIRSASTEALWVEFKRLLAVGLVDRHFTRDGTYYVTYTRTSSGEQARNAMAKTSKALAKVAAGGGKGARKGFTGKVAGTDPRIPAPGSTLSKTYNDKEYKAIVRANGFEYGGKLYPSLRAVAMKITGYESISGHQFFGLASRSNSSAAPKKRGAGSPKAKAKAPASKPAKRTAAKPGKARKAANGKQKGAKTAAK